MPTNGAKLSEFRTGSSPTSAGRGPEHQRAVGRLDLQRPKHPEPHNGPADAGAQPAAPRSTRPLLVVVGAASLIVALTAAATFLRLRARPQAAT